MTSSPTVKSVNARLAEELDVGAGQVAAAARLLDEGATVPFIARYRKEVTGSLDDSQLRMLEERLAYLRELDDRRAAVLASIEEQGKLTDDVRTALLTADTKSRVEDIYLPYKPKRRTKARIAREAGLEPLADRLLADPTLVPETAAGQFLTDGVPDAAAALDGARHILIERAAEDADLVGAVRERFWNDGSLRTSPRSDDVAKTPAAQKFRDYFEFCEPLQNMPSHRVLAVMRGEKEEVLSLNLDGGDDDVYLVMVARTLGIDITSAASAASATLGLDPGFRTGVKVAVVDGTGKVVDTCAVFPHQPQRQWDQAKATLGALVARHGVELIAVGNGTASRETDALAAELIADIAASGAKPPVKAVVSEAGASVYSASAYAAHELPELDVTLRGAVSIARRLQDPLAGLVKIEPKSIGVGQYQHDVTPGTLARSLDAVVEDAVNAVGVKPADFADDRFGVPTVSDILAELQKPGRDPRPAFSTATFAAGVEKVADLKVGMVLEGVVTNVAAFGAFVDVGVHQDGLVHVSAMADRFVSDPHEVVRSGQVVRVKVVDVDVDRQRIGLSLRLGDTPQRDKAERHGGERAAGGQPRGGGNRNGRERRNLPRGNEPGRRETRAPSGSMAQALRDAGFDR